MDQHTMKKVEKWLNDSFGSSYNSSNSSQGYVYDCPDDWKRSRHHHNDDDNMNLDNQHVGYYHQPDCDFDDSDGHVSS